MWPKNFSDRLVGWNNLRDQVAQLPLEPALQAINTWWFRSPWRPYYLHWDDQATWPDPWQLLSDDIYCDLARGLGILYTISLVDRRDFGSAVLVLTEQNHNLVIMDQEKYILNWEADSVVNTNLDFKIKQRYSVNQIKH